MADKHNYKELLGARLEALHMEETKAQNLPTEEDMLRWEKLAAARRAEKKRHMRTLTSIAAAVLFIFAVGITIIIGPPNAEAGGDGEVVIIDNVGNKEWESISYGSLQSLPSDIKENFIFYDDKGFNLEAEQIELTKIKKCTQVDIVYVHDEYGQIEVTQVKGDDDVSSMHNMFATERIEEWGNKEVFIIKNTGTEGKVAYYFVYKETLVSIYCNENVEEFAKKLIEEAEY